MTSNHHKDEVFRQKRIVKNPIKFKIPLNEEQKAAKEKILNNTLTVLAGKAGSGKTLLACQIALDGLLSCLLYTSPSPRDRQKSRMPSSA